MLALVVVAGLMMWLSMGKGPEPEREREPSTQVRRGLPELRLADEPPPPPAVLEPAATPAVAASPAGPAPVANAGQQKPTEEELLLARRQRAPVLAYNGASAGGTANEGSAAALGATPGEGETDTLAASLRPTRTGSARAGRLADRNYLVTRGTFLDCALITAIQSTIPGFTSCLLTRNIYSDNGRVLLLDRGSIIEGQHQSGQMRAGMNRIFVLWTRVRTPVGTYVELESPGTDELGRSGLPGWVDTHFWERFGGALMLSLVEDAVDYAIARERAKSGGNSFSFSGAGDATQDAAGIAFRTRSTFRRRCTRTRATSSISTSPAIWISETSMSSVLATNSDRDAAGLRHYLLPIAPLLGSAVTEICINRPGEAWTEGAGGWQRHEIPALTFQHCHQLAKLIANWNTLAINATTPILSGVLPTRERVRIARSWSRFGRASGRNFSCYWRRST